MLPKTSRPKYLVIFPLLYLWLCIQECSGVSKFPLLFVVSLDGFRYDYLQRNITPYMSHLANTGAYIQKLTPQFPSKTMPNHYTLATGLLPEYHGVVNNVYFDTKANKIVNTDDAIMYSYNSSAVPIWELNERSHVDRHSGSVMWPGTQHSYKNKALTYLIPFNMSATWNDTTSEVLRWFTDPVKPANLVMMYYKEPDLTAHQYGPNSVEITQTLKYLDNMIENLITSIKHAGLQDKLTVLILTDHGATDTDEVRTVTLNVTKLNFDGSIQIVNNNPIINFYTPEENKTDALIEELEKSQDRDKFYIYKRGSIPVGYKLNHNHRIGDVIIEAKFGFQFSLNEGKPMKGLHGYNNSEIDMFGFAIGIGHTFNRVDIEEINNLDIHPIMCYILNLRCKKGINHLQKILANPSHEDRHSHFFTVISILIFNFIIFFILMKLAYYIRKQRIISRSLAFSSRNEIQFRVEEEPSHNEEISETSRLVTNEKD